MKTRKTKPPAELAAPSCSPLETSDVRWEYEDELPEMEDLDFDAIFKASRVDGVRMYPFVEDSRGNRIWITHLPSQANKKMVNRPKAEQSPARK
jgi:hypothetical protein